MPVAVRSLFVWRLESTTIRSPFEMCVYIFYVVKPGIEWPSSLLCSLLRCRLAVSSNVAYGKFIDNYIAIYEACKQ